MGTTHKLAVLDVKHHLDYRILIASCLANRTGSKYLYYNPIRCEYIISIKLNGEDLKEHHWTNVEGAVKKYNEIEI